MKGDRLERKHKEWRCAMHMHQFSTNYAAIFNYKYVLMKIKNWNSKALIFLELELSVFRVLMI